MSHICIVTCLSSIMTSLVRKSAPMVALYWAVNFLFTYWFISEVLPTPLSPRMITYNSILLKNPAEQLSEKYRHQPFTHKNFSKKYQNFIKKSVAITENAPKKSVLYYTHVAMQKFFDGAASRSTFFINKNNRFQFSGCHKNQDLRLF